MKDVGAEQRTTDAYHALVFIQHLIVFTQTDKEDKGGHVLETVDPLLPFATLATDVEKFVCKLANLEGCLRNTSGLDTAAKDVLVCGKVTRLRHAVDCVEVVDSRIVELELARATDGLFDTGIAPEVANSVDNITREDFGFNLAGEGENGGFSGVILGGELEVEVWHGLEDSTRRGSEGIRCENGKKLTA